MTRRYQMLGAATICAVLSVSAAAVDLGFVSPLVRPAVSTELAPRAVMMQAVRAGDRLVAVGERGLIITSDDNGASWQQALVPTSVTLTSAYFPSAQRGWAVGHYGVVLHSIDGGRTWSMQLDGNGAARLALSRAKELLKTYEASNPAASEVIAAVAPAEVDSVDDDPASAVSAEPSERKRLGKLVKDGQWLVESGPDKPFFDVYFHDDHTGFVVGAFGLVFGTTDGGKSWHPWMDRLDNPFGSHLYDIRRMGDSLYVIGEKGAVFRSDDQGGVFTRISTPFEGTFFGMVPVAKGSQALLLGLKGNLLLSDPACQSWTPVAKAYPISAYDGLVLQDGTVVLAMENGQLLLSRDDARTFSAVAPKISYPFTSATQAADGSLVLTGVGGVERLDPSGLADLLAKSK